MKNRAIKTTAESMGRPILVEVVGDRLEMWRMGERDHLTGVGKKVLELKRCAADIDGECGHARCPQIRDGEPGKTGRHCPLDTQSRDGEGGAA